jgi:glyoxylase-like metal-dependent hydrolase (beta-lactamase superfamily II)
MLAAGLMLSHPAFAEQTNSTIENPSELRFSVIVTAESGGAQEAMVVSSGSWLTQRKLVHNAILIEHPRGRFLWDSGIGTKVEDQMEVFAFWEKQLFKIENVNPAIVQLNANNYPLDSITAIIPSHMHWDHASGIEDFPTTPVWIQKAEHEAAHTGEPPGFVISQFDSPDINWQTLELNNAPYQGFAKSLDIYNDGSLVLVDMAGHSQGHLGLFVNTPSKGRYFFIGDTTWTIKGVEDNEGRPGFVQWLTGVDHDVPKNLEVIDKIHNLSLEQPELVIVPAHDEIVTAKLPRYPEFL